MFSLGDKVPHYLLGKYQLISTVIFTALFSLVFLLVSIPFSDNAWFKLGANQVFAFTVAFFVIALSILIISKRIMYLRRKDELEMTYLVYILWNLGEVVLICLLYTFFTKEGERLNILDLNDQSYLKIFLGSLKYGTVSFIVPYILAAMYFAIQDKNNTIKLMNMGAVVGDIVPETKADKRITLFDNNSVLKFSVNQDNLYYIESDDNYIKVWYKDIEDEIKQYMLRCKLKTVEESFSDSDLIRCHRKYIVNISKIKVLMREKDSYMIDLGLENVDPIPISKTYEESVLAKFNSR